MPRELAYRRKVGQSVPLTQWFRGPLASMVTERLANVSTLDGLVDQSSVDTLVAQHQAASVDHRWMLWKMLALSAWKQRFDELRVAG